MPPQQPHSTVQLRSRPRTRARSHDLVPDVPTTARSASPFALHPSLWPSHSPPPARCCVDRLYTLNMLVVLSGTSWRPTASRRVCRVEGTVTTTPSLSRSSPRSKLRRSRALILKPPVGENQYLRLPGGVLQRQAQTLFAGFLSPDDLERAHFARAAELRLIKMGHISPLPRYQPHFEVRPNRMDK